MKKFLKTIESLNIYLKIILFLCCICFVYDVYLLFAESHLYAAGRRVFSGFALLYLGQIILILYKDWKCAIISATQCFFALFLYHDYTFYPIVKPFFDFLTLSSYPASFAKTNFLQYVMISMLFSMEMFKTYLMYYYLKPPVRKYEKKIEEEN